VIDVLQSPANSIFDASPSMVALPLWKQRSLCVLNSIPYLVISMIVTTIAIFLSDVRLAVTPPSADKFFTVLASLCLVQFALELVRSLISIADALARRVLCESSLLLWMFGEEGAACLPASSLSFQQPGG